MDNRQLLSALDEAEKALCKAYLACGLRTQDIQELVNRADKLVEEAQNKLREG